MKSLIPLIFLSATVACTSAANVVCYFASWTVYRPDNGKFEVSNIDPSLCTHVMFGFVGLNWDDTVQVLDPWESDDDGLEGFHDLIALKEVNPNLKIMVSMGGWNEGSQKYSQMAADPAARSTLIQSVLEFLRTHHFDGFDLDWEYPGRREGADEEHDRANYITLLTELNAALKPEGYLLSVAVTGGDNVIDVSYDVPALSNIVDFINVMTYDFHGAFDTYVAHHAPLYASHLDTEPEQQTWNVAGGIEAWLARGADPTKLMLGVGTYGRGFTMADPSNAELYAPNAGGSIAGPYTRQDGIMGYNEICELHSDWEYIWDDEQKVPHKLNGNQWVGYDDQRSLQEKIAFAQSKNLGGYMVWSLDTDDFRGLCGDGPYPLLRTIHSAAVNQN